MDGVRSGRHPARAVHPVANEPVLGGARSVIALAEKARAVLQARVGPSICRFQVRNLMARVPDPPRPSASGSRKGTSADPPDEQDVQLSDPAGVDTDVSSVAMDRELLAMGSIGAQTAADPTHLPGSAAGLTDADVMLRVKAGDESAFEYLVQKYRRPMVGFMYRMSHNAAGSGTS